MPYVSQVLCRALKMRKWCDFSF